MSTVITPFQGTDPFSTATFNNRISQINTGFSYISNPNLLDNWYFGNPVNQRGQTSYTGAGYGIDRWILQAVTSCSMLVGDGYITLYAKNNDGLLQKFPAEKFSIGDTITVSALTDTELLSKTITLTESTQVYPYDNSIWNIAAGKVDGKWYVWPLITYEQSTVQSIKVRAAKLELGSQQTLAHQDENGNWVLNEIPDYGEQLRRCQRYFVNFNPYKMAWFAMPSAVTGAVSTTEAKAFSTVPLPVAMRAEPVVSYGGTIFLSQAGNVQVTDVQISSSTFSGSYLQLIYITAGGLTENSLYRVQGGYDTSSYIWLSADL